jgi:hydrogenase assembly chaperone HypC/HupF
MCLVAPGRVSAIDGAVATLDVDGRRRVASILFEPEVRVGDWVIVAGDAVLRRIDAADATAMQRAVGLASRVEPGLNRDPRGDPDARER